MNYYFVRTDRGEVIQEKLETINCAMFTDFTKLTAKQVTFYKANPTASIQEIKNCALNVVSLEDYKAQKIDELDNLSWEHGFSIISERIRNNIFSITNYKISKAQLEQFDIAHREEFHRIEGLIQAATTIQEVDSAFNSNIYNQITL
jgi:hypothetical protein